jgi:hypothetical protein
MKAINTKLMLPHAAQDEDFCDEPTQGGGIARNGAAAHCKQTLSGINATNAVFRRFSAVFGKKNNSRIPPLILSTYEWL